MKKPCIAFTLLLIMAVNAMAIEPLRWYSYIIPGVGQLHNQQYLKAAGFFLAFIGSGIFVGASNDNIDDNQTVLENVSAATFLGIWSFSAIDAYIVNKRLVNAQRESEFQLAIEIENARKERILSSTVYTDKEKEYILKNEIFIGMSKAAMIESIGHPIEINTTQTAYSKTEQCVYPNYFYVYLENGYITVWQK